MKHERVSDERWHSAQSGERREHITEPIESSYEHYKVTYNYYFDYLEIDSSDLKQKSICEIGCARISSLFFCNNYSTSYVIEPTYYPEADKYYEGKNIVRIYDRTEICKFPKVNEVWLFNVLDHVQDPNLIVDLCKKNADIIRFFEPINCGTNNEHPFTFSFKDYEDYFGQCVKLYTCPGKEHPSRKFHGADCAYGVYKCR
jgi:hypothetical protein